MAIAAVIGSANADRMRYFYSAYIGRLLLLRNSTLTVDVMCSGNDGGKKIEM
jgi:hypothetical protein